MAYAIIGPGGMGSALAGHFASKGIEVSLANNRGPSALKDIVRKLRSKVKAVAVKEAASADIVILAVPFPAVPDAVSAKGAGATFVLESAVPHPYELHLGSYSVHTSAKALAAGERNLRELKQSMAATGARRTGSGSTPVFLHCRSRRAACHQLSTRTKRSYGVFSP